MVGTAIPSTYKAKIGTRHQFSWDATVPEIGGFNLPQPYPLPPTLTGIGVVVGCRGFNDPTNTYLTGANPVSFTLTRGSDSTTATVTFAAATLYTMTQIVNQINGSHVAWTATEFAYISLDPEGGRIWLVDKKPLIGDASIDVGLSLISDVARQEASALLRANWGNRTTASTVQTYQQVENINGYLYKGDVSDPYELPAGADSIGLMLRTSGPLGVYPILSFLWSDGDEPWDGTPSFVSNSATGLPPIRTNTDYGFGEFEVNPNRDPSLWSYSLEGQLLFVVRPTSLLVAQNSLFLIDPAYPAEPITETWYTMALTLKPPPGATQLRIFSVGNNVDPIIWPTLPPGLGTRLQAFAWASRQGSI